MRINMTRHVFRGWSFHSIRVVWFPELLTVGLIVGETQQAIVNGRPSMLDVDRRLFVCLVPCFPIVITFRHHRR